MKELNVTRFIKENEGLNMVDMIKKAFFEGQRVERERARNAEEKN